MKYVLEYFDRTKQETVLTPIKAENAELANTAAMKILQDKDFEDSGLYTARYEVPHAY